MNHEAERLAEKGYRDFQLGRFDNARTAFEDALQLTPDDPDMLRVYAHILFKEGAADDEALRQMEAAVTHATSTPGEAQVFADAIGMFLEAGHRGPKEHWERARQLMSLADERQLRHRHFEPLRREIDLLTDGPEDLPSDSPYDQIR